MSLDCISVSDAIWDFAREGELTEEELRHAQSCSSCGTALEEARAGMAALRCIKPYPTAPDCRSAVLSRISTPRTRSLPSWNYAFAVLLVAATIAGALYWPHGRPAENQAKKPPEMASLGSPKVPLHMPEPRPKAGAYELEKRRTPDHSRLHEPNVKRFVPTWRKHEVSPNVAVAPVAPKLVGENLKQSFTPPTEDSQALAYVTWPVASQPKDSYQYGYTVADPSTGEVTKCSVKREGNTIEINMESEPAHPETKPAKESKSNEAICCS